MSNQRQAVFASLGVAAAAVLAGTASADILMNPDGNASMLVQSFASPFTAGYTVHRIYAQFDNPNDQIIAVAGIPGQALSFSTDGPNGLLDNTGPWGYPGDVPSALDVGDDSWVTIGLDTFVGNNTAFTPGFLGGGGWISVITGTSFGPEVDGAYFWMGAPPLVSDFDPTGPIYEVLIAQFTIEDGFSFVYEGNVAWISSVAGFINTPFSIPAPGAMALLGLAGFAGIRRRRQHGRAREKTVMSVKPEATGHKP